MVCLYLFSLCLPDYTVRRIEGYLSQREFHCSQRLHYLVRADCGPHGTAPGRLNSYPDTLSQENYL